MPIYEYICGDCGETFEELIRSIHSTPKVVCPGCGGASADRIPSVCATTAGSSGPAAAEGPPCGCGGCGNPNGPCSM